MVAAAMLGAAAGAMAIVRYGEGNVKDGLLLTGVALFTAWMATAIAQFQARLEGIDEVVRQGKERVDQTDALLEEMRGVARRLRTANPDAEKSERRTVH